ncbi:MAG: DNA polymerase II large subunit [Hadesarchaea archaeon CG08_land_8_20_14_0_20_51_8]|nr:MAG: DNA polymerase II large subunit [Hadesarchaea archaeon CG08_land_8_20_14_0_20_51_8]
MQAYFQQLDAKIKECYDIAKKARSLGLDPEFEPEIPQAEDLAARVEKLVGPPGVSEVIRKYEKEMGREELALKVADMIVDGVFGKLDDKRTAEQAIRTALAIITEGIAAAAPLEGITHVDIKKNSDGTSYLAIYFAGPIRSAGGTAAALAVLVGDFVRRKLYLNVYKPTDLEVERFVEETELYGIEAAHLQYSPSAEDIRNAVRNIPVEITGEPTSEVVVTGYRDLERIETNRVRGGAVLVLCEGVLQKASKILKHVAKLNIDGWSWLSDMIAKAQTTEEAAPLYPKGDKYLDEIIAGRPVFGHPGREGGFRLRYGRARNTGIAAIGVHPATMAICEDFIAVGTQLKLERPGKGGAVTPVDTIEGPIVRLIDGSVVQVNSVKQALELRDKVGEILFLGDLLIGFGEFLENNHTLMPAGYCEEWWAQDVSKALAEKSTDVDISPYLVQPYPKPSPRLAIEISRELGVPLHPAYTYHFQDIGIDELKGLAAWLVGGKPEFEDSWLKSLRVEIVQEPKRTLEVLGVPHRVEGDSVVIEELALPLCTCLGILDGQQLSAEKIDSTLRANPAKETMEIVQILAGITIRQKAPTRIGCRMGRPEKANPRMMSPPVHVLFPVELGGGASRSVGKAADIGKASVEVVRCECSECGAISFTRKCPNCGAKTNYASICSKCGRPTSDEKCMACGGRAVFYNLREIDIKSIFDSALNKLQEPMPQQVKGVRGMISAYKIPEPLEKGILRAKHNVYVFKDGTVRFDATDVPITHVRPREIGTPVEKLRELGYTTDYEGQPLERDDQIIELKVQDVILSKACAEYLLNASKFVDDLLQKFYGLPPYYNANWPADLVGQLVIGLAPHTSVGVAARIVGFVDANVGYAHPYFHAAKRRDCDGDEDAVMLLVDALLNFSKRFLPSTRGGMMDAPLILNTKINPTEIDEEAHNMDIMPSYPLEFYEATLRYDNPSELLSLIKIVKGRLGKEEQYEGLKFTHDLSDISDGPHSSRYKTLETMEEKVSMQLGLARKLRAVDASDVAERLIETHFIPDLKGNIRAFARQQFRCTKCNTKYRRVPLSGICARCGGNLILTVTRGGVEKYLEVATKIAQDYNVSDYTKQRLKLTGRDIKSIFESDAHRQASLADFM